MSLAFFPDLLLGESGGAGGGNVDVEAMGWACSSLVTGAKAGSVAVETGGGGGGGAEQWVDA